MFYAELLEVFDEHMYLTDDGPLAAALAAYAVISSGGDPVWLMVVGPPSSGKSETLRALETLPQVHHISSFTKAGLLAGKSGGSGGFFAQLAKAPDGWGVGLLSDFTTVLQQGHEARSDSMGFLREAFDGKLTRLTGDGGGKAFSATFRCSLLAACTEVIEEFAGELGMLGERFVIVREAVDDRVAQGIKALGRDLGADALRGVLGNAVSEFMAGRRTAPLAQSETERWKLACLASYCAGARTPVRRDREGTVVYVPQPEGPARLALQLRALWTGLVAIEYPEPEALVRRIGLDSIPSLRGRVLAPLARIDKTISTATLADLGGLETGAAGRALADLAAIGVVERFSSGDPAAGKSWALTPEYGQLFADAGLTEQSLTVASSEAVPVRSTPRADLHPVKADDLMRAFPEAYR